MSDIFTELPHDHSRFAHHHLGMHVDERRDQRRIYPSRTRTRPHLATETRMKASARRRSSPTGSRGRARISANSPAGLKPPCERIAHDRPGVDPLEISPGHGLVVQRDELVDSVMKQRDQRAQPEVPASTSRSGLASGRARAVLDDHEARGTGRDDD